MEEASKRGYTLRELCEVEDRMGAERYFTIVMTRLKVAEGEDPLMPRWSAIAGSSQFWTKGPLSRKYLRGAMHPTLAKQAYRVALEWLRGKHPEIEVEQDSFIECPEDANVNMDLSQPFDDSSPSEK
ncbi:hypothetical protein BHM03_00054858 [Ensete ventricosum]|nr:hypothetical protein BHM03_00054858 [Ensete ventricosum]